MKKYISAIVVMLTLLSCGGELASNALFHNKIDPEDFVMYIQSLSLNAAELGTVPGRDVSLKVIINPPFATRRALKWTSSDLSVAAVDSQTGEIRVTAAARNGPQTTIIRVEPADDPSLYAECPLTVYPEYQRERSWRFPSHPAGGSNNTAITPNDNGDYNYGNGMWLLLSSGAASGYEPGNAGPGLYRINPDDPYEYGPAFTNAPRSMNWGDANWPSGGSASRLPGWTAGHIRTGGHARAIKIAALAGPFTIAVNYIHNGTSGCHADIRIGDREGLRVQGEPSEGSRVDNEPDYPRTVYYTFNEDGMAPLIFIETNGNTRIYDIIVLDNVDDPRYPPREKEIDGIMYRY